MPILIVEGDETIEKDLPLDDHPAFLQLPVYAEPPILTGAYIRGWHELKSPFLWTFVGFKGKTQERVNGLAPFKIPTDYEFSPHLFCLMLAKIAHCAAVLHLGCDAFEPFLPTLILEKSTDVHDYIGGCEDGYVVNRTTSFLVHVKWGRSYVLAYLCPFAHLEAPCYKAVVGRLKNGQ